MCVQSDCDAHHEMENSPWVLWVSGAAGWQKPARAPPSRCRAPHSWPPRRRRPHGWAWARRGEAGPCSPHRRLSWALRARAASFGTRRVAAAEGDPTPRMAKGRRIVLEVAAEVALATAAAEAAAAERRADAKAREARSNSSPIQAACCASLPRGSATPRCSLAGSRDAPSRGREMKKNRKKKKVSEEDEMGSRCEKKKIDLLDEACRCHGDLPFAAAVAADLGWVCLHR